MSMPVLITQISLLMSRYHAVQEEWQLARRVKSAKGNIKAENAMTEIVDA